jgi:hypothetical protein
MRNTVHAPVFMSRKLLLGQTPNAALSLEAATAHRMTTSPVFGGRPLLGPVVQPQSWHLLEVTPIPCDKHYAMDQRRSRNAEITTAHAQPHRS